MTQATASEAGDAQLGGDGGHAAVVVLDGHRVEDFLGVQHQADEGAGGDPFEHPVVAAAAAAQAHPVAAHGDARDQHRVGTGDRVQPEARAVGFEESHPPGVQGSWPVVHRPVEVEVGLHQREDHPFAGEREGVEEGAGAGFAGDGDVRRDGGRPAYLGCRGQVLREGSRPLAEDPQRSRFRAVRSSSRTASLVTPMTPAPHQPTIEA